MFIFNANAYARNPGNVGNSVKDIVDLVGGELLASRMWNEQKLAYPINGQRKGVYWLSYVRLDGDVLPKFNRACKLNETILRHLVITIDPRLVDTLVAAANDFRPALATTEVKPVKTEHADVELLETEADVEETESVAVE